MSTAIPQMSGKLFHMNGKVATRAELTAMIIHGQNPLRVAPKNGYCGVYVPTVYMFDNDGLVDGIKYQDALITLVE